MKTRSNKLFINIQEHDFKDLQQKSSFSIVSIILAPWFQQILMMMIKYEQLARTEKN